MIIIRFSWSASVVIIAILFLAACGGGGATSPSPTPPAPTPVTWSLAGSVSESGTSKRLSNVRVEVLDGPNMGKFALSDASAAYRITGLSAGGFSVKAQGQGYVAGTQGVTLTADATLDFTLVQDVAVLFASISPTTIPIVTRDDPEYPNQLLFTLTVQESNYVPVAVQTLYFRLAPASGGEARYWECDNAWLTEFYSPLQIAGGSFKSFRMNLVYDGPVEPGTLTGFVEAADAKGQIYRVLVNAAVEKRALNGLGPVTGESAGAPARKPRR